MEFNYERATDEKVKDIFIPISKIFSRWQSTRDHNVTIWLNTVIGVLSWDGFNSLNIEKFVQKTERLKDFLGELDGVIPDKDIEELSNFIEPLEIILVEVKLSLE